MPALPFHRVKEEMDEMVLLAKTKVPPRAQTILVICAAVLAVLLIGLLIGLAARPSSCSGPECRTPVYYFVTNHSASCPAVSGELMVTSVAEGASFEGLVVLVQCRGGYTPFPTHIKCQRKTEFDGASVLEWSGLPVCHPSTLVSAHHWLQTMHARSVSCSGTPRRTECRLQCVLDYVAVEEAPYTCTDLPCRAWRNQGSACFRCDQRCKDLQDHHNPSLADLLEVLGCDRDCQGMVVTSKAGAAVWQSKRTGLFQLVGEHGGRPVYQKNSTKEFLYFSDSGAEWLVGPDFRRAHGGIQLFHNKDQQCPERFGGANMTQMYIDSSLAVAGAGGGWREDPTLALQCYRRGQTPVEWCSCSHYDLALRPTRQAVGQEEKSPSEKFLEYLVGRYSRVAAQDSFGLLAPLYRMDEKGLLLFSHHPEGLVWQISASLTTTPVRGVTNSSSCPDAANIAWEWFNTTTPEGAQEYVKEDRLTVTCVLE